MPSRDAALHIASHPAMQQDCASWVIRASHCLGYTHSAYLLLAHQMLVSIRALTVLTYDVMCNCCCHAGRHHCPQAPHTSSSIRSSSSTLWSCRLQQQLCQLPDDLAAHQNLQAHLPVVELHSCTTVVRSALLLKARYRSKAITSDVLQAAFSCCVSVLTHWHMPDSMPAVLSGLSEDQPFCMLCRVSTARSAWAWLGSSRGYHGVLQSSAPNMHEMTLLLDSSHSQHTAAYLSIYQFEVSLRVFSHQPRVQCNGCNLAKGYHVRAKCLREACVPWRA